MREVEFAEGEYYHVLNRGVHKKNIFLESRDYARFMFYLLFFQSPKQLFNIGNYVSNFLDTGDFGVPHETTESIINTRYVGLTCFALMPNHFHALVQEISEGGVSRYLHRVEGGFSKYNNIRYSASGHLFQGSFKVVHVQSNRHLLHLSAYIHRNPREIREWRGKEAQYTWSSYQDYVGRNRWGALLEQDIILKQFRSTKEYRGFLKTSSAKLDQELLLE